MRPSVESITTQPCSLYTASASSPGSMYTAITRPSLGARMVISSEYFSISGSPVFTSKRRLPSS